MALRIVRGIRGRPQSAVWLIAAAAVAAVAIALSIVALKTGRFHLHLAVVTKVGTDLYQDAANPGFFIQTRLCVEPARGVVAVLKFKSGSESNKLIFGNAWPLKSCSVVRVFKGTEKLREIAMARQVSKPSNPAWAGAKMATMTAVEARLRARHNITPEIEEQIVDLGNSHAVPIGNMTPDEFLEKLYEIVMARQSANNNASGPVRLPHGRPMRRHAE